MIVHLNFIHEKHSTAKTINTVCKQSFSIQKKQSRKTQSLWRHKPFSIKVSEVQSPMVLLHEELGHVVVISAVQARLGKCLAHSHVGFFQHGVAFPWVQKHGCLPKVVQLVQCGRSVPDVLSYTIRCIGNQGPPHKDSINCLSKFHCCLLWQKDHVFVLMQYPLGR